MKLNVLISTLNEGIHHTSGVFLAPMEDVHYSVVHQITASEHETSDDYFGRSDVTLIKSHTRGLSKSRNIAIQHAVGDIGIFADDDVRYKPEYFREIVNAFQKHPELAVAAFRIKTGKGEPSYKKYHDTELLLTPPFPHFISSVETTFRIKTIREHKIQYDERFGLGSGLIPSGEEGIFINDCLKKGLQIRYFPAYIVEHPYESSGKTLDPRIMYTMTGAVDARNRGRKSVVQSFRLTAYMLPKLLKKKINPFLFLFYKLKGNFVILFPRKKKD